MVSATHPSWANPNRVPHVLMVKTGGPSYDSATYRGILAASHAFTTDTALLSSLGMELVHAPEGFIQALSEQLDTSGQVLFNEPDIYQDAFTVTPNDALWSTQWDKVIVGSPAAWSQQVAVAGVVIAIIGSGIDPSHPDFSGQLLQGYNVVDGSTDTSDVLGHETKVAGVCGAGFNNSIGIAGGGAGTKILPIRMTDSTGATTASWHAAAIQYAANWAVANSKKVVINDSWGSTTASSTVQTAVNYAWSNGLVICAAGANAPASNTPIYPAAFPNVIGVGASNSSDLLASYSSYGSWVDVFAPGGEPAGTLVETTFNGGAYGGAAGTSLACPQVAYVLALCWAANTAFLNSDIVGFVTSTLHSLGTAPDGTTVGRLDHNAAITAAKAGTPAAPPVATTPVVTITSPATGQTVSGTVTVNVTATSNVTVTNVVVSVDGSPIGSDTSAPFQVNWNTKKVHAGSHTISAYATNSAGQKGTATSITVTK